jgi:uncharacterized membrane protein YuzA (DUF378 family)
MNPQMSALIGIVNLLTLVLVVVGALNWLLIGAMSFNAVAWLADAVGTPALANVIYVLVGISAILHIFTRDYYLPFLGQTAYPCGSLVVKTPDLHDTSIVVKVKPNVNVIYWAAEKNTGEIIKNPWLAYSEFANTGVAKADVNGHATLSIRRPATYRVPPFGKKVRPHVHYRTCNGTGILGSVSTIVLQDPKTAHAAPASAK